VVLIVLDAARVDHFGLYGYSRDTTPEIDRLGRESLVFTQVVAECSYTLCSMPSLLTGLSYVRHGLVRHDLVLDAGVGTLAERLTAAGYRTVGYTSNPYNSTATGLQRGYEEFHEIWSTDPAEITAEVTALLAAGGGERPLFLMLHYVPPHEPYDPSPEFDIFGDGSYAGPVTSDRDLVQALYANEIELDEADLAELVALYDGNLRRADAAVGRVLAALRGAGIYDDTLVVVTSDHGEAFLEHGWIGHNKTIHDEMLRVPLVVKLPSSWPAEGVATDRLTGLADVATTIDRRLGLDAPPEARGQDLLASADDAERILFLRSAQEGFPYVGVRTRRFKAILREGHLPKLYDVRADPGEKRDLFAEHPLLHAGLTVLLSHAMKEDAKLRARVRAADISEEQRKMLEALGYLGN
jgi:arylsulfatase